MLPRAPEVPPEDVQNPPPRFRYGLLYLKLSLASLLWGGNYIAGRLVAMELPPFSAAFLRFLVASLLLLLISLLRRRVPPAPGGRQLMLLLLLALSGVFLFNLFYFAGLRRVSASRGSVIIALSPGMVALGSALIFRQKISIKTVLGLLAALAGTVWVITGGRPQALLAGSLGLGELCLTLSMLCWSVYSLAGKSAMRELSPLAAISWSCWLGTLGLAVGALWEGGLTGWRNFSLQAWFGTLYLGALGTVLALLIYYQGIKRCGPTRAAVFINLVPVWAILLGVLLLGETLSPSLLFGAAAVITGISLTGRGKEDRESRPGRLNPPGRGTSR